MKKTDFTYKIFLLLLFVNFIAGQEIIKPIEQRLGDNYQNNTNVYYKDTNERLQDLVGSWEYEENGVFFKVTFYKLKINHNEKHNVFGDKLFAKFLFIENGNVVYDNYENMVYPISANVNTKPSDIESTYVLPNHISFLYTEPSMIDCHRRKVGRLEITYLNNATPQIQWVRTTATRYFRSNPCDNGVLPDDSDFLIPANMVLTKIE